LTLLDTLSRIETPEGIALELRAAGIMPRALAWLIDLALRFGAMWALSIPLVLLGAAGEGVLWVVMFVLVWLYQLLFEVLWNGQTPGKKVMGLRVVRLNGAPVGWLGALTRNLLRVVDMLPFCYGFGAVSSLLDARSRRLGDLVAGTLVIYTDQSARSALPDGPSEPLHHPLTLGERSAIVAFAERAPQLSAQRQQELANLLGTLTGSSGETAVAKLMGIARTVLGR
jgi:uncharacterized RDD family membrane protein YckC